MHNASPQRGRYRLHPTGVEVTRRRIGEANPRGRLERHLGPFQLREGLSAPGAMSIAEAVDLVVADWERQVTAGTIRAGIIAVYQSHLGTLQRLAARHRMPLVGDLTVNFLLMWCLLPDGKTGEPVTDGTKRVRRAAARSLFETCKCLGIIDVNPAKSVEFSSPTNRYVKALSDEQIRQLQRHARMAVDDTRTPAALALVMSGATTMESAFITVADVDLTHRRVWVHDGGYRQRPRWITLCDDWCTQALTRRVDELRTIHAEAADEACVAYKPHSTNPTKDRQGAAGGTLILRLMKFARVHQPGVTRAESIREWYAAKVFAETGSIAEVARRLGMSSLDAAAHLVGYDWLSGDHAATFQPPAHRMRETGTTP